MLVNAGDPITGQYTERTEKWKAIAKKAKQDYKQEGFFTDLKFENIQDKLGVNGQWINERMKEERVTASQSGGNDTVSNNAAWWLVYIISIFLYIYIYIF